MAVPSIVTFEERKQCRVLIDSLQKDLQEHVEKHGFQSSSTHMLQLVGSLLGGLDGGNLLEASYLLYEHVLPRWLGRGHSTATFELYWKSFVAHLQGECDLSSKVQQGDFDLIHRISTKCWKAGADALTLVDASRMCAALALCGSQKAIMRAAGLLAARRMLRVGHPDVDASAEAALAACAGDSVRRALRRLSKESREGHRAFDKHAAEICLGPVGGSSGVWGQAWVQPDLGAGRRSRLLEDMSVCEIAVSENKATYVAARQAALLQAIDDTGLPADLRPGDAEHLRGLLAWGFLGHVAGSYYVRTDLETSVVTRTEEDIRFWLAVEFWPAVLRSTEDEKEHTVAGSDVDAVVDAAIMWVLKWSHVVAVPDLQGRVNEMPSTRGVDEFKLRARLASLVERGLATLDAHDQAKYVP